MTSETNGGDTAPDIGEAKSFDNTTNPNPNNNPHTMLHDRRSYSLDDIVIAAEAEDDTAIISPTAAAAAAAAAVPAGKSPHSPTRYSCGRSRLESEEDDDIRLAKEMALAIGQNPHMTPEELKALQERTRNNNSSKKSSSSNAASSVKRAVRSSFKVTAKGVAKGANRVKGAVSSAASAVSHTATGVTGGGGGGGGGPPTPQWSAGGGTGAPAARGRISSGDSSTATATSPTFNARKSCTSSGEGSSSGSAAAATTATAAMVGDDYSGGATAPSIRITGIVWKRRSGLGKYSSNSAWERRRIVLQGSRLLYFKTLVDSKDEEASTTEGGEDGLQDADDDLVMPSTAGGGGGAMSFLSFRHPGGTTSVNESARGYLDLLKEQACISASYGHSGAPTPFALSIKVLSQTKWKLCFDTHQELMQWLGAMTDVVVEGSVDAYNALILEQYDPSHGGGGSAYGQLSEPPKGLAASDDVTKTDAGGHRLWAPGHYNVRNENYPSGILDGIIPEDELEDVVSDDDSEMFLEPKTAAGSSSGAVAGIPDGMEFVFDPTTGKDVWGIPANQLFPMVVLLNVALCVSRASSLSTDMFWHLITFVNVALLGILTKEKVGGNVKPKLTHRVSSRTGFSVSGAEPIEGASDGDERVSLVLKRNTVEIPEPKDEDYKPVAGTTTMKIANPTDLPVSKDGVIFGGWRDGDSSIMLIRSVGYKKNKQKVPSPGEMYTCVNVDIFESRTRFPDMASRVSLPKVEFKDGKGPKTWNAPDLFVISIAIPTDPPKLYGNTENGGGYTITIYYAMKQETRDILRRVTADGYNPANEKKGDDLNTSKVNAVRLLEEWCRRAPTDDSFMARFKVVPNAQNLKEIGLPSWIAKYNGKPFLIKRPGQTGFLYRHPEKSCIEFDISLHPFPYLAKQGICFMKEAYFKKVLVTFGFLIEGRTDDELPECLIGLFQLCYPDPIHAIQGEDFFAGKCPSSF